MLQTPRCTCDDYFQIHGRHRDDCPAKPLFFGPIGVGENIPPEGCLCASFFTIRGTHKKDCPCHPTPQPFNWKGFGTALSELKPYLNDSPQPTNTDVEAIVREFQELTKKTTLHVQENFASLNSDDLADFLRSRLQTLVEHTTHCNKPIDGKAICRVKLDCHLHDWRSDAGAEALRVELRGKLEAMIEKEPDSCACQGRNLCIWHVAIAPQNAAFRSAIALLDQH